MHKTLSSGCDISKATIDACLLMENGRRRRKRFSSVRQWVAHAGLDPRKFTSGDSVGKQECISKVSDVRLRRAPYMPALVAIRWEPNIGAFYDRDLIFKRVYNGFTLSGAERAVYD